MAARASAAQLLLWLILSALLPQRGAAHPGPAEPPWFADDDCITVVDKRVMDSIHMRYSVGFDDVMPEPDKITLPDSKTHQFFAFRGAIVPLLPGFELRPFYESMTEPLPLPLWIGSDDLARAEAANGPTIAPHFHAADIGDDVLHARFDLSLFWLPIGERVPITIEQAMKGLRWDVRDVPAGLYQIAGYTFSPPYNAWETRPGWIKVVDETTDLPAVTVDEVDESLFGGAGRRVKGCVNAPQGSTLRAWYRLDGAEHLEWVQFAEDVPVEGDRFELCFAAPTGIAGTARVRVAVSSPNGAETAAYAPDRVALIGTPAPCVESTRICCTAGSADALSPTAMQGTAGAQAVQSAGAAAPPAPAPGAAGAAAPDATPAAPAPVATGCSAMAIGHGTGATAVWSLLALLFSPALGARLRRRSGPR